MPDRLEELNRLILEEPNDPFLKYARALELEKRGNSTEASTHLQELISLFPDYLPAYYQSGRLLITIGNFKQAAVVLKSGIALAQKLKNRHAHAELNGLLEEIISGEP